MLMFYSLELLISKIFISKLSISTALNVLKKSTVINFEKKPCFGLLHYSLVLGQNEFLDE